MEHLQSIGALETIAFVVFITVGIALRTWLMRAERDGGLDRSRWVFRPGAVARNVALRQREVDIRHQPEQELAPLPFRDQLPADDPPA